MNAYWSNLGLYGGMISAAVLMGGIVPVFLKLSRTRLHIFLALSAGLMFGATLMHLLPDAIDILGAQASFWVLQGFLFLYLFEKFVTVHICEALDCEVHTMGLAAVVGISVHALTDGIALGSGLMIAPLGFIVFLTIFFHKLPEAFALTTILLHERQSRSRIIFFNILLVAMVPIGALIVRFVAGGSGPHLPGMALAFSAGTFLHISVSDILPDVHKHTDRPYAVLTSFLAGLGIMYALERFHGGV